MHAIRLYQLRLVPPDNEPLELADPAAFCPRCKPSTRPGTVEQRALPYQPPTAPLLLRELIDLYLRHAEAQVQAGKLGKRTLEEARRKIVDFRAYAGDIPVRDCRGFLLTQWLDAHPSWQSPWTTKGAIAAVKRLLNWSVENGLCSENPFARIRSGPAGPEQRPSTDGEYVAMWRAARPHFRRLLKFLRRTGARGGEAIALSWPQIDLDLGLITQKRHKTARHGRPRWIVLEPGVLRTIRRMGARRGPQDPIQVFLNADGGPWTKDALETHVRRVRERAGLEPEAGVGDDQADASGFSLHKLRHRFSSDGRLAGVDYEIRAILLGHSLRGQTSRYTHVQPHEILQDLCAGASRTVHAHRRQRKLPLSGQTRPDRPAQPSA